MNNKVMLCYGLSFIGVVLFVLCAAKSALSQTGSMDNQWMGPGMWLALIFVAILYIMMTALYMFLEEAKVVHIVLLAIGLIVTVVLAMIVGLNALDAGSTTLAYMTFIAGGFVFIANVVAMILMLRRPKNNYYGSFSMYR
ncbi:hypothetical protein [Kurthia massiliensis]|uniref:hypothetical protein n=1 Tax=Kurthia massiliensis TaxID=1033739 RepID=UPI00028973DA|nr:hypothetical protein [Kurthia massiliensis]